MREHLFNEAGVGALTIAGAPVSSQDHITRSLTEQAARRAMLGSHITDPSVTITPKVQATPGDERC